MMYYRRVAHHTPLYFDDAEAIEGNVGYMYNVYDTINMLLDKGVGAQKLVMGIASYGYGFELTDSNQNMVYCPSSGLTPPGPYTNIPGELSHFEILQVMNNDTLPSFPGATPQNWIPVVDECVAAPIISNGPYWIGFDDVDSVTSKVQYGNQMGLAGSFLFDLSNEDHMGIFGQTFPLLNAINVAHNSGITSIPSCGNTNRCDPN